MKTWLITGASRGLGKAFAMAALQRGDKVAVTARKLESLEFFKEKYGDMVLPLALEARDRGNIIQVFKEAVAVFGHIDILVNNAGYIQLGALEETTEQEARDEMEVLFWGAYYMTREAVAHMRPRRLGTIVQVSSLAGIGGLPGNTMYAASKYALEGMSEALAREVESFGIKVIIVEPAGIRTDIGSGVVMSKPMPEYEHVVGPQRSRWALGEDEHAKGDPVRCAEALLRLVDMDKPPLRFLMSAFAVEMGQTLYRARMQELRAWETLSRGISDL